MRDHQRSQPFLTTLINKVKNHHYSMQDIDYMMFLNGATDSEITSILNFIAVESEVIKEIGYLGYDGEKYLIDYLNDNVVDNLV